MTMEGVSRIAAIDIGTVTTRLLVADVSDAGVIEVERSTDITQLGEGLAASGVLSDDAIGRVAGVVERYARRMSELGVTRYTALATSAARDASNADVFAAALQAHGVTPRIIDGSLEAELSFLGATFERQGEGLLVVDCGGGSTELVVGDVGMTDGERTSSITASRSIDVGSRRMTDMFLRSDPHTRNEIEAARAWAVDEFRPYFSMLESRPSEMIGLAGTATSLASMSLELVTYDSALVHGYRIEGAQVSDLLDTLSSMDLATRMGVAGLHPQRAGVIVAGILILETVMALAGLDAMTISEHDILYGILLATYRDLL